MSITLHLGVVDVPYSRAIGTAARRVARWRYKKKPWQGLGGTTTTGDVASILESRYGIMEMFMTLHGEDVAEELADAMQDKLDMLSLGQPTDRSVVLSDSQLSGIETYFRDMLDQRELDGKIPGVPTGAAQRGVNHRMKHPYARRGARPSFIDTGLFGSSFKAWVT